jgi:riboflavin kinase/FMN adenylyltransferase
MIVIQDALDASDPPREGIATIGNYDGVHRGQRAILDQVAARASAAGCPAVVVTFDPHPLSVLRPAQAPLLITTPEQKERQLRALDLQYLLIVRFTRELARMPARQFVRDFLHRELAVREIHVGATFTFGREREGNLALLTEMGQTLGFTAHPVEEVIYRGERISSTRIRAAIGDGRIAEANDMLGRPFAITGTVARGDRMGQRLGWPTINVASDHRLLPGDGVYVSRVHFPSYPATFDCVTNVGTRPTVYENYQRVVESHILDFSADVYGERVELQFHRQLREERIFPTVMDLSAQIGRDVEATREHFARKRMEEVDVGPAPKARE